jgi:ppGpp synthetase/RelA/SpoT-type nucleotidyltranferase
MSATASHTVSPFEEITPEDYPGIFGDFDKDGIPNVDDPNPLKAGDNKTVEEVSLKDEIKKLIDLRNVYQGALDAVMDRLRGIDVTSSVKGRVKSPYSVINKLRRKRIKGTIKKAEAGEYYTQGLTDMAGCMIVLENQDDLERVVKKINAGDIGKVFEHEDFYKEPLNGYRAHHFIILYSEDEIPVEIQVKTKRMAAISTASHTPYKNGNLNADRMLELTGLAVKADKGDEGAISMIDPILADVSSLEKELTVRKNRAEKSYDQRVANLKDGFRELVKMYQAMLDAGKVPEEMLPKVNKAMQNYAETLGMDFYEELEALDKPEKEPAKSTIDDNIYRRNRDLELADAEPISLTRSERKKLNEKAIKILEKQDREIVAEDIETLRKYTGAGGVEYASSEYKRGKMNEHYTSYPIIQMIWEKLQTMGVNGGNFLEPGSGIGNFAGFIPDRDQFNMVMVEKSPISSRIANILFPQQEVIHQNFAETDLDKFNLTGAVGNVPFGNVKIYTRKDPLAELKPNIHDYFILKSIDSVEPGSPIALITSTGTMDKKDSRIRKAITKRARLVAAYRLPSTAFKDNADTLVTTDLLIFQKFPETDNDVHEDVSHPNNQLFAYTAMEKSVTEYQDEEYTALYNPYYRENPDHILGEHIQGHNVQFYSRMGVKGKLTDDIIEQVINDGINFPYPLPEASELYNTDDGLYLDLPREYNSGSLIFHEGSFYEKQNKTFEEVSIGSSTDTGKARRERIKSACLLLDTYSDFVRALAQDSEDIEPLRKRFKKETDEHIDRFGLPDEDDIIRDVFKYDSRLYKLTSFVKRNPITDELKYADIYQAESMYNKQYVAKMSDSTDLNELAMFGHSIGADLDLDYYQSVYKGGTADKDEVENAIKEHENFFYNPVTEQYEFKYEYLAGDVREKLREARANDLEKNVKALEEVVPEKVSVYEIGLSPRHVFTYLPPEAISQWLEDVLGYGTVEIGLVKDKADLGNRFYFRFKKGGVYTRDATDQDMNLGWGNTPYSKIVLNYITDRTFDLQFYDENGNHLPTMTLKKAKKDGRDGLIQRARKIQRENRNRMLTKVPKDFENWVRVNADNALIEKIEEAYNNKYNAVVNPDFTGETIRFRGMSNTFYGEKNFKIYKHNRAVAEKLIWNGRGANCHDVGAGKTMSSIITNQALLQQGAVKKPMFVVPGKVQEKWVEEYTQLFPDAKILNMKFADSQSRFKELAMAQLYSWDAIFISENSFKRLPLSPSVRVQLIQERIDYFDEMIENFGELIEEEGAVSKQAQKSMIKRLEAQKEAFETQIRDLSAIDREDTDIYFDELGVDGLFVDEAHFYKNALGSAKANKLGIAASKPSQRAEDMIQKTQWLYEKIGYRNVFLLTATPVVNSPIEVWHMLQLCAPDMLKENDIDSLDNFINLFVREENKIVKKTTGEYAEEMVVSGYFNLPEMQRIIDQVMDVKSYDQLQQFYVDHPEYIKDESGEKRLLKPSFLRPEANYENEVVEPSRIHELLFEDIILRAENILDCMSNPDCEMKDNFLVITGDGSRIATDLRIYDDNFKGFDDESLKVQQLIPKVVQSYNTRENPSNYRPVPGEPDDIYGNFFYGRRDEIPRENPPLRNQIIFCDFITTKDGDSFPQIIKQSLVKQGIPASEIAIINGNHIGTVGTTGKDYSVKASDDKEVLKKEVQDDFNAGKYRIIIGNKSIAEGMNLQKWTTDIHHLDVPYTPSEIQQRNGRGLRQGNNYSEVNIRYYLMADSFDQYRLELVNKKQNWIDQLFYGDQREVGADDDAASMNYEEMVSATTSDPEIKKFFEAKASLKNLATRISTLEAEKQRVEGSLRNAKKNSEAFLEKVQAAKEKEESLKGTTIDIGYDDAGMLLESNDIEIRAIRSPWGRNDESYTTTIESELVERRYFGSSYVEIYLDVPQTNPNAYVNFRINLPTDVAAVRTLYGRKSWAGLKRIAKPELQEIFDWDKFEVGTNSVSQIASEKDFERYYGIDLAAEKERDDTTWKEVKDRHNMFDMDTWEPVIKEQIAKFILALEKAWIDNIDNRIEVLDKGVADRKKKIEQLQRQEKDYSAELSQAKKELETNQELVNELIDKVKELTQTEYDNRTMLYQEINRLAPTYGVKGSIPKRDVGMTTVSGKPAGELSKEEELEGLIRENPDADYVYIGVVDKMIVDQVDNLVTLKGNHAMLTNKQRDKLFVVPFNELKEFNEPVEDKKAEEVFEMWHNYEADDKDFTMDWPDEQPQPVGFAHSILYLSDKIMRDGDAKGDENMYHHDFDPRQRTAFKQGNVLIVEDLEINERGILN